MNAETFRDCCLALPHAEEGQPFGPEVIVYKVGGKMFALLSPDEVPARANLKCDPDRAQELRESHEAVQPGYHMNKRHWNTITLDGSLAVALLRELIIHSYELVASSLPKRTREALALQLTNGK